ncbi:Guanine nucleotide exchange protein smcr8a [Bulinus truncatus]|nr:Guanine nucleotide exchange protein smcr8a [Bulinus truncatus]
MFGEYAQIASYLQQNRDGVPYATAQDCLPAYLCPPYNPPQPWNTGRDRKNTFDDFIMVAEFSELEGPKPVMTIPKDGGVNFDKNTFAVKILAVDHQNTTDGFSITEDAQVVLSELEVGIYAFVHHLVLYDNTARGFVRPYCIAYVTTESRKLTYFYEEISRQFKKAARYLKYGNKMLFVGDLERHLKDLEHTKGYLLNQVSKIRLKDDSSEAQVNDARKNAENEMYRTLQTIRQSSTEIKEILSILKPLLTDRRLEALFRDLEEKAFRENLQQGEDKLSLQDNWFNDLSSLEELDLRCGSLNEPKVSPLTLFKPREYKPLLVETKKAKRFNAPLRGLHELCSWGAKEGLKKLRLIHEHFAKDLVILEIKRNESRMLRPRCTSISHGHCVTGNFLSDVYILKSYNYVLVTKCYKPGNVNLGA